MSVFDIPKWRSTVLRFCALSFSLHFVVNRFPKRSIQKNNYVRFATTPEWIGRDHHLISFMNDPSLSAEVYENNFFGSPFWPIFWDLVDSDTWEPVTFRVFKSILKGHKDVSVIDFGAWIGPTAIFSSKFCSQVHALEPDPIAFSALVANVNLNYDLYKSIHVYPEAITAVPGFFEIIGKGDSMSRTSLTHSKEKSSPRMVRGRTLPQFVADEGVVNIRLLKTSRTRFKLCIWLPCFALRRSTNVNSTYCTCS